MANGKFKDLARKLAHIILPIAAPRVNAVVNAVEAAKDETPPAPTQKLQGSLTLSSLAIAMVAEALQGLGIVPDGYDSTTAATVVVLLIVAGYGRIRREWR